MTDGMTAVLAALAGQRFSLEDEKRTQNQIWAVLLANEKTRMVQREVRIAGGIIDFVIDAVGIEVKLKGQPAAIARQLKGYAKEPALAGLVLLTAKPVLLGPTVGAKPVVVRNLGEAWL